MNPHKNTYLCKLLALPISIPLAVGLLLGSPQALAEDSYFTATLQNDLVFGNDGGGYTNGGFLSKLRLAAPDEPGIQPPLLFGPIVRGLGMKLPTLASTSLGQIMITPRDKTLRQPDPHDAPYIGALILRSAQVTVHDEMADMLALDLGMVGPASGAEQTQRFVHRLMGSDGPEGWDSQVGNKPIVSLEGYRAWRFVRGNATPATAAADVVVLAGGMIGNIESSVGGSVLLRYGSGLERSFPTVVRVTGRTGDPVSIGRGWSVYGGFSGDRLFNHIGIGTDAPAGNTARLRRALVTVLAGVTYGWSASSLTFSLQSSTPLVQDSNERQSYGSITYIWKLD